MAEVTIRYTSRVVGHPDPGYVITVERTPMVDGILAAGLAVIVESASGGIVDSSGFIEDGPAPFVVPKDWLADDE